MHKKQRSQMNDKVKKIVEETLKEIEVKGDK